MGLAAPLGGTLVVVLPLSTWSASARGGIDSFNGLSGKLFEERRVDGGCPLSAKFANPAVAHIQLFLSTGDTDEKQSPLLFHLVRFFLGTVVRQNAFLETYDENDRKFQTLCRVHGHQGDAPLIVVPAIDG